MNTAMNATPVTRLDLSSLNAEAWDFALRQQTLHLATCDAAGLPEASYAPYVEQGRELYVYVSEIARHWRNLAASGRCAVLFIESEAEAKTPFARQRLALQCTAREVARGGADFDAVMALFRLRFGKMMNVLEPMQDFHLYRLTPTQGSYVTGFARAFRMAGDGLSEVSHRSDEGHRTGDAGARRALSQALVG